MPKFQHAPTPEQQAALDGFGLGEDMVLEARAGTGKTSTLQLLGESTPRYGMYVAYNKAIATEAEGRFPPNVQTRTAHSLAFRAVGTEYAHRLNAAFIPLKEAAAKMGIRGSYDQGYAPLRPGSQARLALEMVDRFCQSDDTEILVRHRPYVEGMQDLEDLGVHLLPFARKAWEDLKKVDGVLRFNHDHYLKIWGLTKPQLDIDFVLFDEAQDANPVISAIVDAQDAQRVLVGDRAQAIYGWRGAIDAMEHFTGDRHYLSQSFRFGAGIAAQANRWLDEMKAEDPRILGSGPESVVGRLLNPRAILCRSNAETVRLLLQPTTLKVHLMGGGTDILAFCRAATELREKGWTGHRDLIAFSTWGEVQDFAEEEGGSTVALMVRLIDAYGADKIAAALSGMHKHEPTADLTLSTAHKAKGREWDSVQIGRDFAQRQDGDGEPIELTEPEMMLRYVAVTRARLALDVGPL